MLTQDNFTKENIERLQKISGNDPSLLEKTVYAFGLLEAISKVGMPFMVQTGQKKFVSYNEGKDIYSVGLHTFQEIAKEAGAVYHIKRRVLVNTEIVDQYLEAFRDDPI